jgi:hypothetical protein
LPATQKGFAEALDAIVVATVTAVASSPVPTTSSAAASKSSTLHDHTPTATSPAASVPSTAAVPSRSQKTAAASSPGSAPSTATVPPSSATAAASAAATPASSPTAAPASAPLPAAEYEQQLTELSKNYAEITRSGTAFQRDLKNAKRALAELAEKWATRLHARRLDFAPGSTTYKEAFLSEWKALQPYERSLLANAVIRRNSGVDRAVNFTTDENKILLLAYGSAKAHGENLNLSNIASNADDSNGSVGQHASDEHYQRVMSEPVSGLPTTIVVPAAQIAANSSVPPAAPQTPGGNTDDGEVDVTQAVDLLWQ